TCASPSPFAGGDPSRPQVLAPWCRWDVEEEKMIRRAVIAVLAGSLVGVGAYATIVPYDFTGHWTGTAHRPEKPDLAMLATDLNPLRLPAEVEVDRIPELLGEIERLRAILWARLALRINRPAPTEDYCRCGVRLGVSKDWL